MPFPENLRRLRLERWLTQTELAEKSGVAQPTIARLERGAHPPRLQTVRRLAQALGVQPSELAVPDELAQGKLAA